MATEMEFELCPETGIGSLRILSGAESIKVDLMPDEALDLQNLVQSGDVDGAKALLVGIDSRAGAVLDGSALSALAKEIG